jgi:penicillin-binding protein A
MARRRSRTVPTRRAGSVLLDTAPARRRRGRRYGRRRDDGWRRARWGRRLFLLLLLAALVAGALAWRARTEAADARREAVARFAAAWEQGDRAVMWRTLSPTARRAVPERRFVDAYRNAERAAGVRRVQTGRLGSEHDGRIAVPVAIRTEVFGSLRGTLAVPVSGSGDEAGVDWNFALRLPGLRRDEAVVRRSGPEPRRAQILAADGRRLDATPLGASIAGRSGDQPTGLERVYDDRLGGHPSARLLFGDRVIARTRAVRGRPVRTFFDPGLAAAAQSALGGKLGGVTALRPSDGAVLALAGLAVSAPQPPGSTFKVITTAAALDRGIVKPSTTFPVQTGATLSGVTLRNASGEACGGTLQQAFAESCNSVFAPLGAKLGAKRLVAAARAFGFGEKPRIPAAETSTISPARALADDLAVGSAAIGQEKDLATPLAMASVAGTIATDGRRAVPRVARVDTVVRRRAVSRRAAQQVRSMMIDVVRSGTGTSAAVPGVTVAGKTGTAELRPNSSDPRDADAWFVAFAPAERPRIAVAVMLVGAGFGGTAAAPVAREVIQAALG